MRQALMIGRVEVFCLGPLTSLLAMPLNLLDRLAVAGREQQGRGAPAYVNTTVTIRRA